MKGKNGSELGMTTKRIEALTDGIFAIAMTLLVLNLSLPQRGSGMTPPMLQQMLLSQSNKFYNYVLSFMLLAVFWILHHQQFHFYKRTDRIHLWINIVTLMFVALIPFSASLVGDFPDAWVDELFFASNLFVLGVLFAANWAYATAGHRLVDAELDKHYIEVGKRRSLVLPLVSFVAMMVALVHPPSSSVVFISIPFILALPLFRR